MKNKTKIILSSLATAAVLFTLPRVISVDEEHKIIDIIPPRRNLMEAYESTAPIVPIQELIPTPISTTTPSPIPTPQPTINPLDIFNEVNQFAYIKYDSFVYDNYTNFDNPSFVIESYQKVYVVGCNGVTYNVMFDNGETGYILVDSLELMPRYFIETDLSDHLVNCYIDNDLVHSFLVDIGTDENPTDMGYFEVYAIDGERNLCGATYVQPVHGFIVYNGGEGFHDIILNEGTYYTQGYNLSHGCTRMNTEDFYTLNDNVEVGTKVLVHK